VIDTGNAVGLPPATIVTDTPVPLTITSVAPDKFDPDIVAENVVPRSPVDGEIDLTTGGDTD
jgi:hypothetical protein